MFADRRYHAKALAGRRLHDPPILDPLDPACTVSLKTRGLRINVVGFNVDVYATCMSNFLHLDIRLIVRCR